MSKRIQLRRGTTAETSVFTGAVGEVSVDTTKNTLVVHDGVTAGGHPLMNEMSFGVGNERLDVTASRAKGVTYTNATGALKMVSVRVSLSSVSFNPSAVLFEESKEIDYISDYKDSDIRSVTLIGVILPNRTYKVNLTGAGTILKWIESI